MVEPIILDDNEVSIMAYAEEYPENWKKICEAVKKKSEKIKPYDKSMEEKEC